jgi:hypothetical protein
LNQVNGVTVETWREIVERPLKISVIETVIDNGNIVTEMSSFVNGELPEKPTLEKPRPGREGAFHFWGNQHADAEGVLSDRCAASASKHEACGAGKTRVLRRPCKHGAQDAQLAPGLKCSRQPGRVVPFGGQAYNKDTQAERTNPHGRCQTGGS